METSVVKRPKTIRQQMHEEDLEQFQRLRAGNAERHRDHFKSRWERTLAEHRAWVEVLDAVTASVTKDLAAVDQLLKDQRERAEAKGRQPNDGEILDLDGDRRSAYRWACYAKELRDALLDCEEGFTPVRSGEFIKRVMDTSVRPRPGCLVVWEGRFGRTTMVRLIEEAKAELERVG